MHSSVFPSCRRRLTAVIRPLATSLLMLLSLGIALAGCQTRSTPDTDEVAEARSVPEVHRLRPGDVIKISFPAASQLDMNQTIRHDGRINLYLIGEVLVAGMTPSELEQDLIKRYEGKLTSSEVNVTVESSAFEVWVAGEVQKPGRVDLHRPITLLEALMEAGGFTPSAKTTAVVVMRKDADRIRHFTLNLQQVLDGKDDRPFYLRPGDVVNVPKKFQWL